MIGMICGLAGSGLGGLQAASPWFGIRVIDEATGRGVPLISLKTTSHQVYITDSSGWIALQEPDLMEREVFFHVSGPGYAMEKDGFGYAGVRLTPQAGARVEVKVRRENIAERLYRVTGQGLYRDAVLLGVEPPAVAPTTPSATLVTGQDSVQAVPWKGRLFWLWGDSNIARYPLGNFHVTSAWSDFPDNGGLPPSKGVRLDYLHDQEGKLRQMMPLKGRGAVWMFGLLTVRDQEQREHLLAHYNRHESLDKQVEHGIATFDEGIGHFVSHTTLEQSNSWRHPRGNAVRVLGHAREFFYFTESFPVTRVEATAEAVLNPGAYEALAWSAADEEYVWQKEVAPLTQEAEEKMVTAAVVPPEKARLQIRDALSDKAVKVHRASVNWNKHRQRWVMIAVQQGGDVSYLGEVWYAEAERPEGPWRKAIKIASHPGQSFYNPRQHSFFDEEEGRFIYFEGTYTHTFSGQTETSPLYEYNQLMYRLDVDDPRLKPAR